jgi:hypothetical protein
MPVFSKIMIHTMLKTRSTKGFTLVELTVAAAVSLTVLGTSLGIITELRRGMLGDRTRITANDNLRQASDFIGQDIKQAGERLESNTQLPGISIIPGAAGAPSTLVIQRQLVSAPLPVCQNISAGGVSTGTSTIDVSVPFNTINGTSYGSRIANCPYSSTASATTPPPLTSNLKNIWQDYRLKNNRDPVWAYIYQPPNPTAGVVGHGEFFQYSGETTGSCVSTSFPTPPSRRTCNQVQRVGSNWQYNYTYNPTGPASDPTQPQLYLLEERRYSTIPDPATPNAYILQLTVNRQTPLRIANNLSDFQVWAKVPSNYVIDPATPSNPTRWGNWGCGAGGSVATAPNPTSPTQWYCTAFNIDLANTYSESILRQQYLKDWQDLQGVRITLSGINPNSQLLKVDTASANNILKLSSEFFPRNVLSKGN